MRPRPSGKALVGLTPGRFLGVLDTRPQPAPSWGSSDGGQECLGEAGQGQGLCWALPLVCWASEQSQPSPTRRPPGLI